MRFTAIVASLLFSAGILAHGGGLDRSGCHRDRTAGGYHCHRGTLTGGQARPRAAAYDREDYLPRWADADGDYQDTRQEVLIAESRVAVTLGPGQWHDPYTGRVFTDPGDLGIDHLVLLKEVHDSGALPVFSFALSIKSPRTPSEPTWSGTRVLTPSTASPSFSRFAPCGPSGVTTVAHAP